MVSVWNVIFRMVVIKSICYGNHHQTLNRQYLNKKYFIPGSRTNQLDYNRNLISLMAHFSASSGAFKNSQI